MQSRFAMRFLARLALRVARDETGSTAVEYSVISGMLFLAIVPAAQMLGTAVVDLYNFLSAAL
jgi:Flp pilus assembly pilin Flp